MDGIEFNHVEVKFMETDCRPAFYLEDVKNADFYHVKTRKIKDAPMLILKDVRDVQLNGVDGLEDVVLKQVRDGRL